MCTPTAPTISTLHQARHAGAGDEAAEEREWAVALLVVLPLLGGYLRRGSGPMSRMRSRAEPRMGSRSSE